MNIQNHSILAERKWNMAQALRDQYRGKKMKDDVKAVVKHLEEMANEHYRTAWIMKAHVNFIRS